jgi:hypothetical protein
MAEKLPVATRGWAGAALACVVAGLLAAQSHSSPGVAVGAAGAADVAVPMVDRAHKSDRLNVVFSSVPDAHASGHAALRYLMQRSRRELRETCEPPASPYVDPQLAKLPGRCLT